MKSKSSLLTIAILIIAMSSFAQETGSFTDTRDGKTYKTIKIVTQVWMAENLAFKTDSGCWAYNNDSNNVKTYGYLYNWNIAKRGCPSGWHLPCDDEWTTLINYLGGAKIAGGKLKEIGTTHWKEPNNGANDSSGFAALPGGNRGELGTYYDIGNLGIWWSCTEYDATNVWYRYLYYYNSNVTPHYYYDKKGGLSVRCLKN